MPVRIKAIGYDVDGVLRSLGIISNSWIKTFVWFLNRKGLVVNEKDVKKFVPQINMLGRKRMFEEICGKFGLKQLSQADFQQFNEYYDQKFSRKILNSPLEKEAGNAIVFFNKIGYKQFIVSAAPKAEIVKWLFGQMGCQPYIQKVYASPLGSQISKAEAIAHFCKLNGLLPSEVAFVGDMPSDVAAARKAGAKAIFLAPKRAKGGVPRAHRRINSLSQLGSIIQKRTIRKSYRA